MYVYVYRKYTIGELPNSEETRHSSTYNIQNKTYAYVYMYMCMCICMYEVQYGLTFQTVHFAKS